MDAAKKGDTVLVHYTGKLEDGNVFDSSKKREPLKFELGTGKVIPGFENGILGMKQGETKTIHIDNKDAYGERNEILVHVVKKDDFTEEFTPVLGQPLQVKQPNGKISQFIITKIEDDNITLDSNHPLAGKNLVFDLELISIN